jgi:hypothetical protein
MKRHLFLLLFFVMMLPACFMAYIPSRTKMPDPVLSSLTKTSEPAVRYVPGSSRKVCQLTGDYDWERDEFTLNKTLHVGILGTDLGSSFVHEGRTYFLFGDTAGLSLFADDSIAFTTDSDPDNCLKLQFITTVVGLFRPLHVPGVSTGFMEVPTGGFSANGAMYIIYATDSALFKVMGRSVLARSIDNAVHFTYRYDLSVSKFINVAPAVVENAGIAGLPEASGQGVLLWGSGAYRKSDPYLAFLPLDRVEDKKALRYYAGLDESGAPRWSSQESDASALFEQPCIGELSVAWNPFIRKWLMLYNCHGRGIVFRSADAPWGPWSLPRVLFNGWRDEGYCHFIHASWLSRWCDGVNDFGRGFTSGGVYGPYMLPGYFKGNDRTTTIYYVMSTWNPYQVVLMRSELIRDDKKQEATLLDLSERGAP